MKVKQKTGINKTSKLNKFAGNKIIFEKNENKRFQLPPPIQRQSIACLLNVTFASFGAINKMCN